MLMYSGSIVCPAVGDGRVAEEYVMEENISGGPLRDSTRFTASAIRDKCHNLETVITADTDAAAL